MTVQIYVGNLNYRMTEDSLRELFAKYGEVESVKIVQDQYSGRSKGFGFVEMSDKDEGEKAIQGLNDSDVEGRNIRVNFARPRRE
ncbi:MAG: RNA-binding protein [Candidatus Aminicenantes bacterium]|nr:RNA-binding protein [Candidatus Aminicenantes bacterium]TEU03940.1 MAG: RNA-binding protein [Candidatus Aminicenantes bacterium]